MCVSLSTSCITKEVFIDYFGWYMCTYYSIRLTVFFTYSLNLLTLCVFSRSVLSPKTHRTCVWNGIAMATGHRVSVLGPN